MNHICTKTNSEGRCENESQIEIENDNRTVPLLNDIHPDLNQQPKITQNQTKPNSSVLLNDRAALESDLKVICFIGSHLNHKSRVLALLKTIAFLYQKQRPFLSHVYLSVSFDLPNLKLFQLCLQLLEEKCLEYSDFITYLPLSPKSKLYIYPKENSQKETKPLPNYSHRCPQFVHFKRLTQLLTHPLTFTNVCNVLETQNSVCHPFMGINESSRNENLLNKSMREDSVLHMIERWNQNSVKIILSQDHNYDLSKTWVLFSDDDDQWHYQRSQIIFNSLHSCFTVSDEKKHEAQHSDHVYKRCRKQKSAFYRQEDKWNIVYAYCSPSPSKKRSPTFHIEYHDCVVRLGIVRLVFHYISDDSLKHNYCDLLFSTMLQNFGSKFNTASQVNLNNHNSNNNHNHNHNNKEILNETNEKNGQNKTSLDNVNWEEWDPQRLQQEEIIKLQKQKNKQGKEKRKRQKEKQHIKVHPKSHPMESTFVNKKTDRHDEYTHLEIAVSPHERDKVAATAGADQNSPLYVHINAEGKYPSIMESHVLFLPEQFQPQELWKPFFEQHIQCLHDFKIKQYSIRDQKLCMFTHIHSFT